MPLSVLSLLAACSGGEPYTYDTGDTADTGVPQCGRIRGTEGVLMYQEDGGTVRSPLEAPNTYEVTTGIAGPIGDDRTYLALVNGRAMRSEDGGCNWDDQGSVATGDWRLLAAGTRVYAFDAGSSAGARSDDGGLTWAAFDAGEAFVGLPVVDAADPDHLYGVQARGLVSSTDAGDTWTAGSALPAELSGPTDADLLPSDPARVVVGGATGAWISSDAGAAWSAIGTDAVVALALHPDDANVLFAITTDADGLGTLSRSSDGGTTWSKQVDSTQIAFPDAPLLWPVPGNPLRALSASGPVHNENTDSDGVNLYIVTGGDGTRTTFTGGWSHIWQIAFGADRWLAAVDAATAR